MRAIPIIMSGPMVRAMLAGNKTETRRMLYGQRKSKNGLVPARASVLRDYPPPAPIDVDHYVDLTGWHKAKPGDLLWVRENLTCVGTGIWRYAADDSRLRISDGHMPVANVWTRKEARGVVPSIHMPKFSNRLVLELTGVKIERLQLITRREALREGVIEIQHKELKVYALSEADPIVRYSPVERYAKLWSEINGPLSWLQNPWVVVLTGTVHLRNIASVLSERGQHEPKIARPAGDLFRQ